MGETPGAAIRMLGAVNRSERLRLIRMLGAVNRSERLRLAAPFGG
jgi:hypothetical protein